MSGDKNEQQVPSSDADRKNQRVPDDKASSSNEADPAAGPAERQADPSLQPT